MPTKQAQRAEINNFVQGLITEASPLNFPPNASADEANFELHRDGSRKRRMGMDLEDAHTFLSSSVSTSQIDSFGYNTFQWEEVAGDPRLEFLVVQFNRKLFFFDVEKESISGEGFIGELEISEFPTETTYSFSAIEGSLVVVAGVDTFAVISYDNGAFFYSLDRIKIRDHFGVEETIADYETDPTYRGSLDVNHYYNLQNQSWGTPRRGKITTSTQVRTGSYLAPNPNYDPNQPEGPSNPSQIELPIFTNVTQTNIWDVDPILAYRGTFGYAPSNSEQVWVGLQFSPRQFNGTNGQMEDPFELMYMNLYKETFGASTVTAKGYYIIDALRRGQSRQEEVLRNLSKNPELNKDPFNGWQSWFSSFNFKSDYTTGGASCVAEFAGRVFFSGFRGEVIDGDNRSPNYTNYVFFSKLVTSKNDINKCYQEGDPTGRDESDIIDTDGGFLRISEAKDIHTMVSIGSSLIVIASNGVWSIDGGSDYGFSATNYKVTKLTTFGGLSPSSVVVEGDRPYFWANDGIYMIGKNQLGDMGVESLTLNSIQSLYDDIPFNSKLTAKGMYDTLTKKVRWVYNTGNLLSEFNQTKELVFDTALGAFTINTIGNTYPNSVNVIGVFQASPFRSNQVLEPVVVDTDFVNVSIEEVVISRDIEVSGFQETKYVCIKDSGNGVQFSFCYYKNPNFLDWENVDGAGVDAKAYCLTGTQTLGDSGIDKQIPYLIMHFIRTENMVDQNWVPTNQSGCLFRCQWNFANSVDSKKWSPLQQGYRYRKPQWASGPNMPYTNGFEVISTKNKVRGRGKAFALYLESEPGKDCQILGWNVTLNGNSIT